MRRVLLLLVGVAVAAAGVAVPAAPTWANADDDLSFYPKGPPPPTAKEGDRFRVGGKGFNPIGTDYDEIKPIQPCVDGGTVSRLSGMMTAFNEAGERVYRRKTKPGTIQLMIDGGGNVFIIEKAGQIFSQGGGHHRFVASMRTGVEILAEVVEVRTSTFPMRNKWKDMHYADSCDPEHMEGVEAPEPTREEAKELSKANLWIKVMKRDTAWEHCSSDGSCDSGGTPASVEVGATRFPGNAYTVKVDWGNRTVSFSVPAGTGTYRSTLYNDYPNYSQTTYTVTVTGDALLTPTPASTSVTAEATQYSSC